MTSRTKAILGLSSFFVLGALCGALALGLVVRDQVRDRMRLRDRHGFSEFFGDRLDLTELQRDSLHAELELAYADVKDIREAVAAEYRDVFDSLEARMHPVLTPDQRRLLADQRARLLPEDVVPARESASSSIPRTPSATPAAPRSSEENQTSRSPSAVESRSVDEPDAPDEEEVEPTDPSAVAGDSMLSEESTGYALPRVTGFLKKRLALTDEQTTQVRQAIGETIARNERIREEVKRPKLRRAAIGRSFREFDRSMALILTPEQYAKFEKLRRKRIEKGFKSLR